MASYSTSSSSSFSSSSSHSSSSSMSSTGDLKHKLSQLLLSALKTDKPRLRREFYYPEHIALTGQYYPRYRVTGSSCTGSTLHRVSYLARPYYNYKVPSRYGFSKFITVRKL
eukprot:TRINITY_DN30615_c0_g1_i1.p1 TRINITY_DN30615_c0_g1~~TRINITY_DN30615_c0_g1_i1.p1  ORF type:complete len:112 (-),score=13.07 TRINITY_DN30615_c0_g1_i1:110-445(-)